jgi:RND family efflux transporter MFP subunit
MKKPKNGEFMIPLVSKAWTPLLIFVVFFTACESGEDRSAADLAVPVTVEKVRSGPISEFVSATGTLRAQREERLVTEVAGILSTVKTDGAYLSNGSRVRAGQMLAEIENREWLLEVRVESQKLAMENAKRELEKQQVLFEEGGVTEKELELARRTALDTRLNYEAAQLRADKLNLRAPISGIISNLQSGSEGTYVPVGFQFCAIMDYGKVVVDASLPNTDMDRIRHGQQVDISNYSLEGEIFAGKVTSIDPTIDPRTRTFTVSIETRNPNLRLRPGMFVKADIIIKHQPEAVIIPRSAIQTRDNRSVVFVVEGVSAEMREITEGISTREEVEIIEGLNEGDRLVIEGHETLRDKSKVRVTE